MSGSTLLNIALNSKIFDNFTIEKFEPIMLTNKYKIENEVKYIMDSNVSIPVREMVDTQEFIKYKDNDYIEPKQHDSLFWCLYIIAHGYNDYKQIGSNYGVKELEEKQKIFHFIKSNISSIKNTNYKITNVAIQEMQSEFMTVQKRTSFLCLIAMTVYYNINVFIVDETKHTILEFLSKKDLNSDPTSTYILYTTQYGKYRVEIENISTSKIMELREKYITLDSYLKPLKALSNYKVDELETLLKKTGQYDDNKKYKKQDLYDKLLEVL